MFNPNPLRRGNLIKLDSTPDLRRGDEFLNVEVNKGRGKSFSLSVVDKTKKKTSRGQAMTRTVVPKFRVGVTALPESGPNQGVGT